MNNLENIEKDIANVNEILKRKYDSIFNLENKYFRESILGSIGKLKKIQKLDNKSLVKLGSLVAIDGSTNKVGGAYPHYIEIFRALAKSTSGKEVILNSFYTPLILEDEGYSKDKVLAQIELDAAIESIYKLNPDMIMMDGGLIRYQINDKNKYEELVNLCNEKNIILFGVIKDIKTNIISRNCYKDPSIYDKELLFGRLEIGEVLEIKNEKNNKYLEGNLVSAFLRTSSFAGVVGLDILENQRNNLEDILNLIYTLTPESSRGVPLWLDIVDKEVKITEKLMRTLLEEYLDRDIYEKFFISERDRRSL